MNTDFKQWIYKLTDNHENWLLYSHSYGALTAVLVTFWHHLILALSNKGWSPFNISCSFAFCAPSFFRQNYLANDQGTMVQNRKKHRINRHIIIHCPTSEVVSKVSERASEQLSAAEHVSKASSAEQANEWAVRVNERADERVAQYFSLYFWLFWLIQGQLSLLLFLSFFKRVKLIVANDSQVSRQTQIDNWRETRPTVDAPSGPGVLKELRSTHFIRDMLVRQKPSLHHREIRQ